jgi:hypothetical protein
MLYRQPDGTSRIDRPKERMTIGFALLVVRAWWELVAFDLIHAVSGFRGIHSHLARQRVKSKKIHKWADTAICESVALATRFYFRPVLCLQRSVAAAKLLRKHGIAGRLVIGYRAAPFFSHAWVEVNDRVLNDSPAYKERLQVLVTI